MDTKAKNPTIGVRLNQEERDILEKAFPNLSKGDAIRILIAKAGVVFHHPESLVEAQRLIQEVLGEHFPKMPLEDGSRSILLEDIMREVSVILATAINTPIVFSKDDPQERLRYEEQVINRCFDLLETLLRHSFADSDQAFDPKAVRNRLQKSRGILVSALSITSESHRPVHQQ